MNYKLLLPLLFFSLFLFGCTQTNIPGVPYTTSQLIVRSTDLNYTLFREGYYDGNFLTIDGNKLGVSVIDFNNEEIPWSSLIDFPTGCADNQAVKIVDSTLVCVDLPTDTNYQTAGYGDLNMDLNYLQTGDVDLSGLVPYTGATTDVNLGANDLTVGGQTVLGIDQADLGFMTSKVKIVANTTGVSGVQMGNIGTGTGTDFRFILKDSTEHYFAFAQPGSGNTQTLWGKNRKDLDMIFNSGGTSRDLIIGSQNDLFLGAGGLVKDDIRLIVEADGDVKIPLDNVSLTLGAADDGNIIWNGTNMSFGSGDGNFLFYNNSGWGTLHAHDFITHTFDYSKDNPLEGIGDEDKYLVESTIYPYFKTEVETVCVDSNIEEEFNCKTETIELNDNNVCDVRLKTITNCFAVDKNVVDYSRPEVITGTSYGQLVKDLQGALKNIDSAMKVGDGTIDTVNVLVENIYTKSKVPEPTVNYCKMINDANIYNKASHYAYKYINGKWVLDAEYRWVVLEGCEKQKLDEMCIETNHFYSWCPQYKPK